MIAPLLLASTPHRNRTALVDTAGTIELYLRALVDEAGLSNVTILSIGTPGGQAWLDAVQQSFKSVGEALGVPIPNLADFELNEATDFSSWSYIVANTLEQLRIAAGVA